MCTCACACEGEGGREGGREYYAAIRRRKWRRGGSTAGPGGCRAERAESKMNTASLVGSLNDTDQLIHKTERDAQAWLRDQTWSDQRGQGWGEMS